MVSAETSSQLTVGAALLGLMLTCAAHATPVASVSGQIVKSDVLLVAGGCGAGFHRGAYGYCVPNGPVVVGPRVCPPGYRLGPMVVGVCQSRLRASASWLWVWAAV